MSDTLDFGFGQRIRDAKRCLARHTDEAIDQIGMDVAMAATKARRQDLRDALSDREGRKFPVEWNWAIGLAASEDLRAEIAKCLVEPFMFGIAPIKPLTAEEKLARLEYRVATRFGEAGAELVEGNRR